MVNCGDSNSDCGHSDCGGGNSDCGGGGDILCLYQDYFTNI